MNYHQIRRRASAVAAQRTTNAYPAPNTQRVTQAGRQPSPYIADIEEEDLDFADNPPQKGALMRGAIRRSQAPITHAPAIYQKKMDRRRIWRFLGLGAAGALGTMLVAELGGQEWSDIDNQWRYGFPRTFQIDAVVGHSDSTNNPSHFLAINYRGNVVLEEWPGGNYLKSLRYTGDQIITPDAANIPITLEFKDVNGDGKPDMIIHVNGQYSAVMINTGEQFRGLKPGETYSI